MKQLDELELPSPIMPIYFPESRTNAKALIDTGASLSVVRKEFIERIGLMRKVVRFGDYKIRVGDGKSVPVVGQITLRFLLGKLDTVATFAVLEQGAMDCILGIDFLYKYGLKINFDKLSSSTPMRSCVFLKEDKIVKPHAEMICKARLNTGLRSVSYVGGDLNQKKSSIGIGIMVARTEVRVTEGEVPIRFLNTTGKEILIGKRFPLGIFNIINPDKRSVATVNIMEKEEHRQRQEEKTMNNKGQRKRIEEQKTYIPPVEVGTKGLTKEWTRKFKDLVQSYAKIFPEDNKEIGFTDIAPHKIILKEDAKPRWARSYRIKPEFVKKMHEQLDEMMRQGILEKAKNTPWGSPLMAVAKPGQPDKVRIVIDYRYLNSQVMTEAMRIPNLDECIQTVGSGKPKFFTILDLHSAFFQCSLHPDSRYLTAFTVDNREPLQFKRVPQGLHNAPRVFMDIIDGLIRHHQGEFVLAYLDDILIWSTNPEEHYEHVQKVFEIFAKSGLTLSAKKSKCAQTEVEFLGHIINENGIRPKANKIESIRDAKVPTNKKMVRRYIGMCSFWRKFMQNFSGLARGLYDLTSGNSKSITWTEEAQKSFEGLKKKIVNAPELRHFDHDKRIVLSTDAGKTSVAACLSQMNDDGELKPVFYLGRSLSKSERNYTATQLELLAIVWALNELKYYLEFVKFDLVTDYKALQYLVNTRNQRKSQLERWTLVIRHYKFVLNHEMGRRAKGRPINTENYDYQETKRRTNIDHLPTFNDINKVILPKDCRAIPDEEAIHAPEDEGRTLTEKSKNAKKAWRGDDVNMINKMKKEDGKDQQKPRTNKDEKNTLMRKTNRKNRENVKKTERKPEKERKKPKNKKKTQKPDKRHEMTTREVRIHDMNIPTERVKREPFNEMEKLREKIIGWTIPSFQ